MGTIHHHAIVVVGSIDIDLDAAYRVAQSIFPWVSAVSPQSVNGHRSFFIPPDGSKEGWKSSDEGDDRRQAFIDKLRSMEKNGCYIEWAEVGFGELGVEVRSSEDDIFPSGPRRTQG